VAEIMTGLMFGVMIGVVVLFIVFIFLAIRIAKRADADMKRTISQRDRARLCAQHWERHMKTMLSEAKNEDPG